MRLEAFQSRPPPTDVKIGETSRLSPHYCGLPTARCHWRAIPIGESGDRLPCHCSGELSRVLSAVRRRFEVKYFTFALFVVLTFALVLCFRSELLAQTYTESVLYSFPEGPSGSQDPGKLVRDSAGNLYGTTLAGGPQNKKCAKSCGTIFELSASGVFSTLYKFQDGTDGSSPCCLVIDKSGNLYGLTVGE